MRKAYLYTIFYLLASCKQNDPIEIKQIDSKEIVTILPSLKNPLIKDSICISIPSEFEVIKKSSEIIDIDIFYLLDGKRLLDDFIDYQVFNKNDKTKPIHSLMPYLSSNESIHILIKERNHLISKNDAKELLKKYNINRSIENLKFGDTIKLISYDKFNIENHHMVNDFNKINDSIVLGVWLKGEKKVYVKRKINW